MLALVASAITCIFGLDCDLSESLQKRIKVIPQVHKVSVIQDYGIETSYHARITLNSGDTFDLAYFAAKHLAEAEYFRIARINGKQHDYVFCEEPKGPVEHGRIRHGFFSVGSRGSYQGKFPFQIRNIRDLVEKFQAIKAEYFKAPAQPKFVHDFLPNGTEIYATLFDVGEKYPLGPSAYQSGEPYKNAWKFKDIDCKDD